MPLTLAAEESVWADFLAGAQKSHIMQSWGWGELKARSGWRPHRVIWSRDGAPRVGLSILERDFPKVGLRFFYAARGPVFGPSWTPEDLVSLFREIEPLAQSRKAVFLKIDPDVSKSDDWLSAHLQGAGFSKAPAAGGFSGIQPDCVFRLNIGRSKEEVLAGMDQKTRYNIRLAEKKGVRIRAAASREDIAVFYKILVETARRDHFLIRPEKYFHDIAECLGARRQAEFFLAEVDGRAIAGALALVLGPTAWYAYGASANSDRNLMPNHLMQWTLIQWAQARGCRLYDFRAVPSNITEDNPLYGLYRFKKGFGGDLTNFIGEYDKVYRPLFYQLWARGWPLFKSVRKKILGRSRERGAAAVD